MRPIFLLSLFFPILAFGSICHRSSQDIRTYLDQPESRIQFKNGGGLINGGVCWWHSRLQRSSAYLAVLAPTLPRPTRAQARSIIQSLRFMNRVVEIPGYGSFSEFTKDYKVDVQATLEAWQRSDGFIHFEWLRGISGRSSLHPKDLEKRMHLVYQVFHSTPAPLWIMAQIKGITSHSFLLNRMEKRDTGYRLEVIDSNHPMVVTELFYEYGESNILGPKKKYRFIPYTGFQEDFTLINQARAAYCGEESESREFMEISPGEIELRL